MKLKNLSLLVLGSMLTLTACKKEEPTEPTPDPDDPVVEQPDAAQLSAFFSNNISDAKQNFTIDAASPALITGSQGTTIQFSPNSFEDASGTSVTGNVDIELIEIYGKKDMLFLNKQTLGDDNGNFSPLISGGEFKVTATQGGSEVFLKPWYSYNATVQAPAGVDPNMDVFYQSSVSDDTLTWAQADSSLLWGQGGAYDVYFDSLGWVNCDYFMNQAGNQTSVAVNVPNGFDNTNCALFISFDGLNSLTSLYNFSGGNFTTGSYYTVPEGLQVHFIAMAFIGGTPHAAIVPATITANHLEVISALPATTQAQLVTDIQNLP